jgi:hypothetical protein
MLSNKDSTRTGDFHYKSSPDRNPCRTIPRVIPTAQPLSLTGCSTATETATLSPFSTCELQAKTPGTYT